MNLIVEKTRKNDVSNILGYGNNNKPACRPSDRLTGFLLRRMSPFMPVTDLAQCPLLCALLRDERKWT